MSKIFQTNIRNSDRNYLFTLDWDDRSFVQGHIRFKILIDYWNIDSEHKSEDRESFQFEVSIESDKEEKKPLLIIRAKDKKIIDLPLDDIFSADDVIEKIPSWVYGGGDPVSGCLIRSGLSVTIGQLVDCKNATADKNWFWERTKSMGRCLKQKFPDMCSRLAWRVTKCMLKVGF